MVSISKSNRILLINLFEWAKTTLVFWRVQQACAIFTKTNFYFEGTISYEECLKSAMYVVNPQFHALYFLSYLLAMVGVFLFSARVTSPPPAPQALPQLVNDSVQSQDNVSMWVVSFWSRISFWSFLDPGAVWLGVIYHSWTWQMGA